MKFFLPYLLIVLFVLIFFWQFLFEGLLPIPADTIIGLYHPYRDFYAKNYPNGIPFKNFLITDPIRQQIPWRFLSVSLEKQFVLPLWNPYSFAGTPLLANFQSAPFYPLNLFFFILPFDLAWSFLILLEPLLGGVFLYAYLKNLKLRKLASLLGAITFVFSGFFIVWMQWGTVDHTLLWLPLILLSIDKIFFCLKEFEILNIENKKVKIHIGNKKLILWLFIFLLSLISSFFAGHLQIFFYLFTTLSAYLVARWFQYGKIFKFLFIFLIFYILFFIFTSIQWLPTIKFILLSARGLDQNYLQNPGWFIPWQSLIQFIFPDFFGNPATLNYWGVWNYAEFVGYVGIIPLIMAIYALFFRRDKKTLFFGLVFFTSLVFALPTFLAKLPFVLGIPFISSSQPTRLLAITDFSLAVLAAFGFDYFIKIKKEIFYPLGFIFLSISSIWIFIFFVGKNSLAISDIAVARSNLVFPTIIFFLVLFLITLSVFVKNKNYKKVVYLILLIVTLIDLFRFGWKFLPFTKSDYLFPETPAISFLKQQEKPFRIMSLDSELFPPNFFAIYKLESLGGYDPLYLNRYAQLVAAMERGKPDIHAPYGFNRIITPRNVSSGFINLMGVKYVLSLSDLNDKNLTKVFEEGRTKIYENKSFLPRAFFVETLVKAKDDQAAIEEMFKINSFAKTAIIQDSDLLKQKFSQGKAEIVFYEENEIIIKTQNSQDGFLVVSNTFYPTWHAKIDNRENKIYLTNFNFQGILVPRGIHTIVFYQSLF